MVNGLALCQECFGQVGQEQVGQVESAAQAIKTKEPPGQGEMETSVAETPVTRQHDWAKAQNQRDMGVSVTEIAKKMDVSPAAVYAKTKAPGGKPKGRLARVPSLARKASSNGHSAGPVDIDTLIGELQAKRDRPDESIEALEKAKELMARE